MRIQCALNPLVGADRPLASSPGHTSPDLVVWLQMDCPCAKCNHLMVTLYIKITELYNPLVPISFDEINQLISHFSLLHTVNRALHL